MRYCPRLVRVSLCPPFWHSLKKSESQHQSPEYRLTMRGWCSDGEMASGPQQLQSCPCLGEIYNSCTNGKPTLKMALNLYSLINPNMLQGFSFHHTLVGTESWNLESWDELLLRTPEGFPRKQSRLSEVKAQGNGFPIYISPQWSFSLRSKVFFLKTKVMGLPWWPSDKESTLQFVGRGFDPWSGRIPHVLGQLSLGSTTKTQCSKVNFKYL